MSKSKKPVFAVLDLAIDWADRETMLAKQENRECLYDQRAFGAYTDCGTAHCLAGHIVAAAGYKPVEEDWSEVKDPLVGEEKFYASWNLAAELINIPNGSDEDNNAYETADGFFDSWLSLDEIKKNRDKLAVQHRTKTRYFKKDEVLDVLIGDAIAGEQDFEEEEEL